MASFPYEDDDDIPSPSQEEGVVRHPRGGTVRPYGGGSAEESELQPPRPGRRLLPGQPRTLSGREISQRAYEQGLEGSLKANLAGQLHTLTGMAGMPGDILAAGAESKYVPARFRAGLKALKPILPTSEWARRVVDLPGQALTAVGVPGFEGHATYENINQVPEEYRPMARAGEAQGGTYPFTYGAMLAARNVPAALGAARTVSPSALENIWNTQRGAAASPGFVAAQRPATLGAGAGGYGAELFFPGSDAAQIYGQLLGGGLGAAASAGAGTGAGAISDRIRGPVSGITGPIKEAWSNLPIPGFLKPKPSTMADLDEVAANSIARSLVPHFERRGESVDEVIRNLSGTDVVPGALPAERSGSRVLMGVQNRLAATDENLANQIADRERQFRTNIGESIERTMDPGDAGAFAASAKQYDDFLTGLVNRADEEAQAAASAMSMVGPAERETLNVRARMAVERALDRARTEENRLWGRIDQNAPSDAENTIAAFQNVRAGMLREQQLPGVIERTMARIIDDASEVPFSELKMLRSEALNQARVARASDDFETSRRLNQFADGVLEDMTAAGERAGNPVVTEARNFSNMLHDRFSRSFAGDILGMSETGEPAVRAGLTLERTFSGKPAVQAQQARELRAATEPVGYGPARGMADPASEIGQTQEQFLRTQTQKFVDANTGRINLGATQRYMRDNAQVLEQFPAFRDQLDRAVAAEMAAQRLAGTTADADRIPVLANVLGAGEIPAVAVGQAITGNNPVRDFTELARIARRAGPDAVAGLRASVLSFVTEAASQKGQMSFRLAQEALTKPVTRGGPSLLDMMQNNRVISPDQKVAIIERLRLGVRHETAPGEAARVDVAVDEAGGLLRKGARFLGAKMASWTGATGGSAGTSLQVANMSATLFEDIIAKLPTDRARQLLSRAMQADNPAELIDILERASMSAGVRLRRNEQRALINLLRPLFPRTESEYDMMDVPTAAGSVIRSPELRP